VAEPHPDLNWPPGPQPGESQAGESQAGEEQPAVGPSLLARGARVRSSRAQAWLAELSAGVRRVRELEAGPVGPEALAAGFTHRVRGAVGSGFAGGGVFDRLAPGPDLADFTADAWARELTGLSDDELVGVVCAWRRLGSWAMAGELAAVGELAGRRPVPGLGRDGRLQDGHLDEEVAAALTLTGRAAARLTGLAAGLARLPGTAGALREGRIDGPRAAVIADETSALDDAAARAVEERVLPAAPGQTTGQLRAACRRAVLAADPQAGIRRRQQAEKNARVEAWTETSGTGAMAGRGLPPAEMIAADKRVDALARWLKAHGAPGTLDQLRAKVFTALLAGRPVADLLPAPARPSPGAGTGLPGAGLPAGSLADSGLPAGGLPAGGLPGGGPAESGWPGLSGSVNLTMPLTAWLGLSGPPGEVAGLGPLDAGACRDLAGLLARHPATRWCITLTGPGGRAVAHGCARTGPRSPRGEPPGAGPPGTGPPRAGPPAGRQDGSGPPGAEPMAWLTQITICGLETGTGPCAHTRETRGYRPSAALRHLIKIRDRRCSFPGCSRQAVRCDDDHTIAYDQGGRTCECNLSPLCRQHHRTKQARGWRLTQPAPGTLTWTLPHGRSYTTTPGHYPD
jgi:hypothetical protein